MAETVVVCSGGNAWIPSASEIHTTFLYNGGEKLTFQCDDDVSSVA